MKECAKPSSLEAIGKKKEEEETNMKTMLENKRTELIHTERLKHTHLLESKVMGNNCVEFSAMKTECKA